MIVYKAEGQMILKDPPHDMEKAYEEWCLQVELAVLMNKYGFRKLTVEVKDNHD